MRSAELSGHRVYDRRHTFATLLLAKGAPITYVAAQLGHAKPTTTLQWYALWLPSTEKNYVESLDRLGTNLSPIRSDHPENYKAADENPANLREVIGWAVPGSNWGPAD